jgi:dephospho-CoA kinase
MITIGLTGVLGSGKSTAASLLKKRGAEVIDLDALAKEALGWKQTRTDIREAFGDRYVVGGAVDREGLAREVFTNKDSLTRLEAIIHPRVRQETEKRLEELRSEGSRVIVIDHPLLFEVGFSGRIDKVVVVSTDPQKQRKRLKDRGMEEGDIERRLAMQIPIAQKEARADCVVYNNGTMEDLAKEVDSLWEKITKWEEEKNAS